MDNQEKIQNFGDMVEATQKLTKPWRVALALTNVLWAVVFAAFILLAYLTPDTSYQYQDFEAQSQIQTTGTETVTDGAE